LVGSTSSSERYAEALAELDKMGETFLDAREVLRLHAEGSDHEAMRR
jgi:hypothetical protein